MSRSNILAVDAMGGDRRTGNGYRRAWKLRRSVIPKAKFLIFGDQARLAPLIAAPSG